MKKEESVQVNYRLPKSLVGDLKFVAEETGEAQTAIVRDGLRQKLERKKRQIERIKEKEAVAV